MRHLSVLAVSAFILVSVSPGAAQQRVRVAAPAGGAPGAEAPLPPLDSRAVVADVRRIIAERYVLPERRPALDAILARGLASGRYNVTDAGELAERINADLETAGRDRHLNFNLNPRQAAMLAAGRAAQPDNSAYERQVRATNHGITSLRVLPGNVRYMEYDGFQWIGPESAAALENAMRFLAGGDAVIIDLRRNGGGSPEAVQYIISHFLPANRPLMSFYMNGNPTPDRTETLAEVPAGRMIGKPLYVLTSGGSASAAEEFIGHVGGYRVGELVGENSAGAGFRNDLVPVQGRFVLSVSVGRAVLAATGRDWEAVGLAPTVPTPIAGALETAQALALRRLAGNAAGPDRARLEAMAEGIAARAETRSPALPLAAYAGTYGEREVRVGGGKLWLHRGNRAPFALIPLGGNVFTLDVDPSARLSFEVSGTAATAFAMGPAGLPPQGRFARTP
ncbi:MAG TPA: S41 family peptidase [Allosphingosinicella sp.]|nr:S41 family peptidase [Allosphingosinicella sp.]